MAESRVNGSRSATAAPAVASARGYLRRGLPEAYQHPANNLGMRFVGALEEVLDPIVAMLDLLPAHLDLDLAPPEVVETLSVWLGVPASDVALEPEVRRELVRDARELTKRRGTREGLERLLGLAFPSLEVRVVDSGTVSSAREERTPPAPVPCVVVECAGRVASEVRDRVARVAKSVVPAHVALWVVDGEGSAA